MEAVVSDSALITAASDGEAIAASLRTRAPECANSRLGTPQAGCRWRTRGRPPSPSFLCLCRTDSPAWSERPAQIPLLQKRGAASARCDEGGGADLFCLPVPRMFPSPKLDAAVAATAESTLRGGSQLWKWRRTTSSRKRRPIDSIRSFLSLLPRYSPTNRSLSGRYPISNKSGTFGAVRPGNRS